MDIEERVRSFLRVRWPDGLSCPLCVADDWIIPPEGPHVLEAQPPVNNTAYSIPYGGMPVGVYVMFCGSCGYMLSFFEDAVMAADTKAPNNDAS